jgi:hypothetical protein
MPATIQSRTFCLLIRYLKNIKNRIYKTIILPVVLYEFEAWSLTLREEHRLRVLRRIFGPKRGEVTGGCRELHNEELHKLYSSPNIIRTMKEDEMGRVCSTSGGGKECI